VKGALNMSRPRVVSIFDLEDIKKLLKDGETVIRVPEGVLLTSFAQSLRKFLGGYPTICKIGDDELYIRLTGE
jgi:hypothetical protein